MGPTNYIDPSVKIGTGSRVWHFAVILANVVIGDECNIGSTVEIGHGSKIGNRSRIGSGSFLPPNSVLGEDVFIGPGVICCDDKYPIVNNPLYNALPPWIEDGASVGAGAILLPGIHIGKKGVVGAGAVVTHDVGPGETVKGEPARPYLRNASNL